jgi:hypothetical protein
VRAPDGSWTGQVLVTCVHRYGSVSTWHAYAQAVGVHWGAELVDLVGDDAHSKAVLRDPEHRPFWLYAMRPYCTESFYAALRGGAGLRH